jgi:subtilase family serine protease
MMQAMAATRSRARGIAVALLLASALLAGTSGASAAPGNHPALHAKTRYARIRRACRLPAAGHRECMALGRVPVAAGTVGARPFVQNDGATESGPAGGLTPAQLASTYEYDPAEGGAGQTVALIDAYDDPAIEEDLGVFDSNYGLVPCTTANGCFAKVGQTGSTTSLPKADKEGWSVEITLDVETAHAVCEKCKILLVEANAPTDADLATAVNEAVKLGATEVSNSYGGSEEAGEEAAYDYPGVVITASAGDGGYDDWDEVNKKKPPKLPERPESPASLPTVVSVGGTSLKLNENGTRSSETVWNHNGPGDDVGLKDKSPEGASGGGCSTLFTAPLWQQDVPGWGTTGCGTKRLDNDVAAVADPYTGFDIYDSFNCGKSCEENGGGEGWETWGGTSLSSPIISSIYALAGGSGGVSYPAATLYSHFGQSSFFDVTEGGNGFCDAEPEPACGDPNSKYHEKVDCDGTTACDATPGYDGPSGVGTPKGLGGFKSKATSFITQTTVTLNARVNPNGETVTGCEFEYGTSTSYGSSVPCKSLPGSGTTPVEVSAKLSALTPNTEYHFRIVTSSAGGTIEGPDVTFKTLEVAAPSVETKAASEVRETAATLNASVNPRGGPLSACELEYGTSTAYSSSVPCAALPGSGSSPVAVSASIPSGLAPSTEYHFRISATNAAGTTQGEDLTFKTS